MLLRADQYLRYLNAPEFDRLLKEALRKWDIDSDDTEWETLVKFATQMKDADGMSLMLYHIEFYVKPAEYSEINTTDSKRKAIVTTEDGRKEEWIIV